MCWRTVAVVRHCVLSPSPTSIELQRSSPPAIIYRHTIAAAAVLWSRLTHTHTHQCNTNHQTIAGLPRLPQLFLAATALVLRATGTEEVEFRRVQARFVALCRQVRFKPPPTREQGLLACHTLGAIRLLANKQTADKVTIDVPWSCHLISSHDRCFSSLCCTHTHTHTRINQREPVVATNVQLDDIPFALRTDSQLHEIFNA